MDLLSIVDRLLRAEFDGAPEGDVTKAMIPKMILTHSQIQGLADLQFWYRNGSLDLYTVLAFSRKRHWEDDRDRVFSMLGIVDRGTTRTPDYSD